MAASMGHLQHGMPVTEMALSHQGGSILFAKLDLKIRSKIYSYVLASTGSIICLWPSSQMPSFTSWVHEPELPTELGAWDEPEEPWSSQDSTPAYDQKDKARHRATLPGLGLLTVCKRINKEATPCLYSVAQTFRFNTEQIGTLLSNTNILDHFHHIELENVMGQALLNLEPLIYQLLSGKNTPKVTIGANVAATFLHAISQSLSHDPDAYEEAFDAIHTFLSGCELSLSHKLTVPTYAPKLLFVNFAKKRAIGRMYTMAREYPDDFDPDNLLKPGLEEELWLDTQLSLPYLEDADLEDADLEDT